MRKPFEVLSMQFNGDFNARTRHIFVLPAFAAVIASSFSFVSFFFAIFVVLTDTDILLLHDFDAFESLSLEISCFIYSIEAGNNETIFTARLRYRYDSLFCPCKFRHNEWILTRLCTFFVSQSIGIAAPSGPGADLGFSKEGGGG